MSQDDIVYYNLTLTNLSEENAGLPYTGQKPVKAEIIANNNLPIINNPADYYCSIIRFKVPCLSIPMSIFQVQTPIAGPADIGKGVYSFTMEYLGFTTTQEFLQMIPEVGPPTLVLPTAPAALQDFDNRYYWIYHYQTWINMFNVALTNLIAQVNAHFAIVPPIEAPFFHYEPTTQLVSIYAQKQYFDQSLANFVSIYFNEPTSIILIPFDYKTFNYNDPFGKDKLLLIQNKNNINVIQRGLPPVDYLVVSQPFSEFAYLNAMKSLVIGTNMNIIPEQSFINNPSEDQNVNFVKILTDYIPDLSNQTSMGNCERVYIYNAQSLYRVFQFNQSLPLYNFNVIIYWLDIYGNYHPLYIKKNLECNLKFMFIKKSVFAKVFNNNLL